MGWAAGVEGVQLRETSLDASQVRAHFPSLRVGVSRHDERGLARAPTTLIDAEVFVGRQHLPMIRWILAGQDGPPPI